MQVGKRARIKKGWDGPPSSRSRSGGCSKFRTRPVTSSPSWRERQCNGILDHDGWGGGLAGGAGEGRALGTDLGQTGGHGRSEHQEKQMPGCSDGRGTRWCWGGGGGEVASGRS